MALASGCIHEYAERKIAFEFDPTGSKKVLVFVGGLMDGLLTVPYLTMLSSKLKEIGWTLIQIQISSSHIGWGTGSLARDSSEIGKLVAYLRSPAGGDRETIGFMGHSTGCQNTIHYLSQFQPGDNQTLDFGILQAPVSDRVSGGESISKEELAESVKLAKELIDSGKENELMPSKYLEKFFSVPINAYRWNSLMSVRGDDDFFSPDLNDDDFKLSFGKVQKPLLVLYSGADEYVPDWLDKEDIMKRWAASTDVISPLSKIVDGGKHNLGEGSKEGAADDATTTVIEFIKSL